MADRYEISIEILFVVQKQKIYRVYFDGLLLSEKFQFSWGKDST